MAAARTINEDELDELFELYQMLNPDDPELNVDDDLRSQWQMFYNDYCGNLQPGSENEALSTLTIHISRSLSVQTRNTHYQDDSLDIVVVEYEQ